MAAFALVAEAIAIANGDVPASAAPEFWAGVMNGFQQPDSATADANKALVEECFLADQKMADIQATMIKELADNHFIKFFADVKRYEAMFKTDFQPCRDDAKYAEIVKAKDYQGKIEEQCRTDPQKKDKMDEVVAKYGDQLKTEFKDLSTKWSSGQYYEAGLVFGLIEAQVYEPWTNPSLANF